jgi:MFS family permease
MSNSIVPASRKRHFLGLTGNAKVCIALLPLWGIPYCFYYFYLSLYLRENGVSDARLGILMFAGSAASVVFSFFAAPLVDRMGRRKSTFVFDLLSSALPPLLFAVSGRFWVAFLGFILTGANKIMSVGYYLLMSEDADDTQRVKAFNFFNVIIVAAGVFVPLASGLVEKYGIVATERLFLYFSSIAMALLAILRNRLTHETQIGREVMEKRRGERISLKALFSPYAESLRYIASRPLALAATMGNVLFYVYYILGTNNGLYFTPYFGDALGMNAATAALLGSVFAGGTLAAMLIVNPIAMRLGVIANSVMGAIVDVIGLALLAIAPRGNLAWAIAAVALSSIGYGILKSAIDAAIVVTTDGEARTGIYSTANILSSLFGIVASFLISSFYAKNPRTLYVLSFIIVALIPLGFAVARLFGKRKPA